MGNVGVSYFGQPLVFVDIETNGLDHVRGRVIEVAAIRVERGVITQKFSSLIDPETELPYYITNLTGITTNDVEGAPTFAQIADELQAVLDGAIFVAHNVRFDYSFLKQEFKRLGRPFLPRQLCTVKLSRALYPHERSHKLQSLIDRHGFSYSARHRAYDDAAILWQFTQYISKHFPPEQIEAAIAKQLKSPAIPKALQPENVRDLPEKPGVYIFEDATGQVLYVGKSVNIKKRVMSHFGRDHAETREFKIAQAIKHIRTEVTAGELSALLLESRLVKQLQPVYNRKLRKLERLALVKQRLDANGYAEAYVDETTGIDPNDAGTILAVYPRRARAKSALNDLCKEFSLCPKLLGLEKNSGACFMRQLRKCQGACVGDEPAEAYNQRLMTAFNNQRIERWPYKGPVLVEEQDTSDQTHGIVVDQWCIVGEITQQQYCEPVVQLSEKTFDLDTYKILRSHLGRKLQQLTVKPIDVSSLAQYAS